MSKKWQNMSNVPKLRFKDFSGEWEESKLKEYCFNISSGKSKNIEGGEYYLYGSTGIIGNTDKFTHNGTYILIARVGANAGLTNLIKGKFGVTDNTLILDLDKEKSNISFILSLLHKYNLNRLIFGSGQPLITGGQLKSLKLYFPQKQEQEKIASFLNQVDTKIEQLTKKEKLLQQYKKGVMQKIFNQEIRFQADDGSEFCDWEEKRLKEVLDYEQPTKYIVESTEYNGNYNTPVLTAGKTFILGYTNEENGIYTNSPVIIFDDFTTANHYVDFDFKVKSSAMKLLKEKNENICLKFVYEFIQKLHFPIGEHKRYWISEYSYLKIKLPCLEEQNKIANFLSSIDTKIEQTQKQLEKTKEFKKALLQQMFV